MLGKLVKYINNDYNLSILVRGVGLMYVAGGISIGLTFLQQLTTANLIGASLYGQFATIVGTSTLIFLLVDFRTWEASTKLVARAFAVEDYEEAKSVITWLILFDIIFGFVGMLAVIALATPISRYLVKMPDTQLVIMIYAIMIPFRLFSMGVPTALIRLYDRFDWLATKSIIYAILRLVFISGAAFAGFGLEGVIIGAVFGEVLNAVLMGGMVIQLLKDDSRFGGVFSLNKPQYSSDALRLMRDLWLGATLKGLQLETFVPILAFLVTPAQVGLYRIGMDITNLINQLIGPFAIVIQPNIIKIYEQSSKTSLLRYIRQITALLSIIIVPSVLGISIFGPSIFPKILNPEFADIAPIVTILALGFGFNAITVWLRSVVVAMNLLHLQNVIGAIMIGYTTIMLILLSSYGAIGAAIVMTTFLLIYNILGLFLILIHNQKWANNEQSRSA